MNTKNQFSAISSNHLILLVGVVVLCAIPRPEAKDNSRPYTHVEANGGVFDSPVHPSTPGAKLSKIP
jgi:hypothetical protein